jgi:lipopolysaccharide biosynthesis protein
MIERILQAVQKRHKAKDKYYVQVGYSYSQTLSTKGYRDDYTLAISEFQERVKDFDTYYKGCIILYKNKLENEILRVNL